MISFLTAVVTSRYPTTNNRLRNSSNPRQQATINDERVTLQPVQGRQTSCVAGTTRTYTPGASRSNSGKQRSVTYQANGQILHEEELAFLANPGIAEVGLMANLSHYGSDALAELHNHDNVDNNMINQVVQAMPSSEQSNVVNHSETEITSDSNIIPYSQYMIESQHKAQQLEPKLYDGNIIKNTSAIVIPDSEETLILAEESRSKMILKQKDPMMLEKKVITTSVDYANSINSSDPTLSSRPTKVEVQKELPKGSMVNTSLKKLKHHLAGFDVVVKERTTATAITEGSWGFEHTKACFRDEIILFAVEQHRLESKTFKVKMNQVLNENERLLKQVINKDIVNIIMNSYVDNASVNVHECEKYLKLKTELLNKKDFVEKETYDKLFRSFTILEKHCISLEVDTQLNQKFFQRDNSVSNQSASSFDQYFEFNELKALSQEKDTVIKKLKERIKSL
ncbi:hypothetical protein Tco_1549173, partial [Tanacetum coccineum]